MTPEVAVLGAVLGVVVVLVAALAATLGWAMAPRTMQDSRDQPRGPPVQPADSAFATAVATGHVHDAGKVDVEAVAAAGAAAAGPGGIPLVVWSTGPKPLQGLKPAFQDALGSWVVLGPPGTQVVWFDDTAAEAFIGAHFPQYLPEYNMLVPGAFRADLWRLLVLLRHGGLYVDCGCHLVSTPGVASAFWDALRAAALVMVDDDNATMKGSVFQGVLGARPGHPLVAAAVRSAVANVRARLYGTHNLDITGPRMLGRVAMALLAGPWPHLRDAATGLWVPGLHTAGPLGPVLILDYSRRLVQDAHGQVVIRTKVPGYYKVMYRQRATPHYKALWQRRQVYADGADGGDGFL
jgi:hypothetical protein